jgi:hypothetical protein
MELITSATSLNGLSLSLFTLSFISFQNSILQCLTNWQNAAQILSYFLFAPFVLGQIFLCCHDFIFSEVQCSRLVLEWQQRMR